MFYQFVICVLLLLSRWGNSTRVPMVRGRGGFDVSPLYRVEVEVELVVAASPPSAVEEEEVAERMDRVKLDQRGNVQ